MKTNWHVDNHFFTLSTRWSYQFDDDMLSRCGFETFGTSVPKISASVRRYNNENVVYKMTEYDLKYSMGEFSYWWKSYAIYGCLNDVILFNILKSPKDSV